MFVFLKKQKLNLGKQSSSNIQIRHCEPPESDPIPHTDLEPAPSSRGRRPWRSMPSGCMDCRALACPEFIEGLAVTKALFKVRVR
jgi:hypothetical protein